MIRVVMLPMVEFRVLDHNAVGLGISLAHLMERAGKAVAQEVLTRWPEGKRVVILCGPGNNGGDGIVAARHLQAAGQQPRLVLVGMETARGLRTELARQAYDELPPTVSRRFWTTEGPGPGLLESLERAQVLVDALLGSGLKGDLRPPFDAAVRAMNEARAPVLSVDVPSGLGVTPTVRPMVTVTFAEAKVGMSVENSGDIKEVDIGFPTEARTRCGPGEAQLWPPADPQAHKGSHGKVVIVGGGPYTGAPLMAGLAAYRTGADLVYLLCPERTAGAAGAFLPEFIVQPLAGEYLGRSHLETVRPFADQAQAVVLGPGLGRAMATQEAVAELVTSLERPLVLDADALFTLAARPELLVQRHTMFGGSDSQDLTLLTPHRGELERLKVPREPEALKVYARERGVTLLAKGPIDIITDGEYIKENHTGNHRMAVGGTGDVLAGCVGALRARGLSGYQAARLGAYLVGAAGDLALKELGEGYLATEVADRIPRALELALRV